MEALRSVQASEGLPKKYIVDPRDNYLLRKLAEWLNLNNVTNCPIDNKEETSDPIDIEMDQWGTPICKGAHLFKDREAVLNIIENDQGNIVDIVYQRVYTPFCKACEICPTQFNSPDEFEPFNF